jgi:hypothetical protein
MGGRAPVPRFTSPKALKVSAFQTPARLACRLNGPVERPVTQSPGLALDFVPIFLMSRDGTSVVTTQVT